MGHKRHKPKLEPMLLESIKKRNLVQKNCHELHQGTVFIDQKKAYKSGYRKHRRDFLPDGSAQEQILSPAA